MRWPWLLVIVATTFAACTSGVGGSTGSGIESADASGDAIDAGVPVFLDGAPIDPLASDAALAARVEVLFRSTCAGITGESACHASGAGGLRLALLPDGGDVIDVPSTERPDLVRVRPGDPTTSYLYWKVIADGGVDGSRMPPDLPTVDPRLVALIQAWIADGAPLPAN